jgi:riboflavin kinase / FMN adenylyltransferase
MRVIRGQHNVDALARPSVVTIGNFDGVHRGHLALIACAREHARRLQLPLTVLTFEPTPREFFAPEQAPARVNVLRSKLADLAEAGVDQVVLQRFDARFAAYGADAFVEALLCRDLGARAVIVGDDFRYGQGRAGDFHRLQAVGAARGFAVDTIGTVQLGAERCSSTALRRALAAADLPTVENLLGRPFRVLGRVRGGLRLGRTLGMPTANLPLKRPLALRQGVYAVTLHRGGEALPAVANLGVRPTLGGTPSLLEAHCLVPPGDLYGQCVSVQFHHFLRPELRFDSLEALKAQMHRDRDAAQAWLDQAGLGALR